FLPIHPDAAAEGCFLRGCCKSPPGKALPVAGFFPLPEIESLLPVESPPAAGFAVLVLGPVFAGFGRGKGSGWGREHLRVPRLFGALLDTLRNCPQKRGSLPRGPPRSDWPAD